MPTPRARATIYSVAARAGVSISTVSLAINHPQRVSAQTRRRVAEASEAEGYRPGRSGATGGRSGLRTVAVAAPFSSWPSYYRRLDGILERLRNGGIEVLVHDLPSSNDTPAPLLDALPVRGDLDGVIIMGSPLSEAAESSILRSGIPAVLVDTLSEQLPTVTADDHRGGVLLGEHLLELGHRHLVFVHDGQASTDYVSAGMRRVEGLQQVIDAAGARVDATADAPGLVQRALDAGATAILANHDALAARVLRECADSGVAVPHQLSVTGYDGGALAGALDLTTVEQPLAATGATAADLLIGVLDGTTPAVRAITLECSLVVGGTTGAPAAD
ncbi:LacI family transcriptional regulator [Brachybacterium endophyticum]|uniref:LacI family transcriptional regulator n=1 Tax=Brachybacterium endophyticum TaxID=2182385 RepID=A0A2U2RN43_9MICO|nr:LacI family DNA-binding transcriptional regulator [Brachybacterium endophyticum]PWH07290.1 LacI family transcriptional regulator [Brachybacterium endophyticum]